MDMKAIIKYFI